MMGTRAHAGQPKLVHQTSQGLSRGLASWMGARPPRVLCTTSGHLECAALIRVEDHYPMVYGYPVLLGLIICALSGNFPSLHCDSKVLIRLFLCCIRSKFVMVYILVIISKLSANARSFTLHTREVDFISELAKKSFQKGSPFSRSLLSSFENIKSTFSSTIYQEVCIFEIEVGKH